MGKIIDFEEEKNDRIKFWLSIMDMVPFDIEEYDEAVNELVKLGYFKTHPNKNNGGKK